MNLKIIFPEPIPNPIDEKTLELHRVLLRAFGEENELPVPSWGEVLFCFRWMISRAHESALARSWVMEVRINLEPNRRQELHPNFRLSLDQTKEGPHSRSPEFILYRMARRYLEPNWMDNNPHPNT